jgi:hypothetical protein
VLHNVLARRQVQLAMALAQVRLDAAGRHAVRMRHSHEHSPLIQQL